MDINPETRARMSARVYTDGLATLVAHGIPEDAARGLLDSAVALGERLRVEREAVEHLVAARVACPGCGSTATIHACEVCFETWVAPFS